MAASAKTSLPELRRWAAALHERRSAATILSRRSALLRRIIWAQALIAQHASESASALQTEKTLLRRARYLMLRLHWSMPTMQLAAPIAITVVPGGRDRMVVIPAALPAVMPQITLLHSVLSRNYHPLSTTVQASSLVHSSVRMQQAAVRRISMFTTTVLSGPAASTAVLRGPVAPLIPRRASSESDSILPLIARQVLRPVRVEEQLVPQSAVLLRRFPSPAAEPPAMHTSIAPETRAVRGQSTTWPALQAPQGLNINQITDEVVRQLDSRLIASRERMGKV